MIDPNVDKNFLGTFKRLKDVLAAFPNGGQKGDYLYIGETLYRWDKWDLSWVSDSVISETKTKQIQKFDGEVDIDEELHVGGDAVFNEDIRVKGTAYISRVKQPNVGFFATLQELQEAYPNPTIGMWATVGSTMPAPVYRCDEDGVWSDTGTIGGIDPIERTYYYTREEADEAMRQTAKDEISKVNFSNNEYVDESVGALRDDINTQLETLQEDLEGLEDSINTLKTDTEEDLESLRDEIGSLSGYDDTEITNAISSLNEDFDALNDTVTIFKDLFDSLFEKDDANNAIKAKLSLYSVGGITAGGIGSGSSSGGGGSSTLEGLNDVSLKSETANDVLVYNGTHWVNTPMSSVKPDLTEYATKSWVEDKGYALNTALLKVDTRLANVETIFEADQDGAINKWSEVVYFLNGIKDDTLDSILSQFATQKWVEENYLPIDGTAKNAEKLGNQAPAYYATATALSTLSTAVTEFRTLFDSLFEKDTANNAIKAKLSLYSVGGITAGGVGSGGSSGGGGASYNRLDAWADYTNDKSGWVLSALLGKDLDTRVNALANAGYITSAALDPYAKTADVANTYATKTALQGVDIRVQAIEYIFEKDNDGVINKWSEIVDFLAGVEGTTLDGILDQFATKDSLAGYLPLSGGTLTNSSAILTLSRTVNGAVWIDFFNSTGKLGAIGIGGDQSTVPRSIYFHDSKSNKDLKVWHEGNMGTGSGLAADSASKVSGFYTSNLDKLFEGNEWSARYHYYEKTAVGLPANTSNSNSVLTFKESYHYTTHPYGWQLAHIGSNPQSLYLRSINAATPKEWREFAFVDSNVASATKLQTPRTIWGRSFDGTGDVDGSIKINYTAHDGGIRLVCNTQYAWHRVLTAVNNNMISGDHYAVFFGQSESDRNGGYIDYTHSDNGSSLNRIGIGFYSNDHLFNVLASGNVGIGTTNPAEKLDVAGNIKTSGSVRIGDAILSWDATNKCVTIKNANTGEKASLFVDGGVTATAIN